MGVLQTGSVLFVSSGFWLLFQFLATSGNFSQCLLQGGGSPLRFTEFGGRVLWWLSKIQEFEDKPQKQVGAGQGLHDYLGPTGQAPSAPLGVQWGCKVCSFYNPMDNAPGPPWAAPAGGLPA